MQLIANLIKSIFFKLVTIGILAFGGAYLWNKFQDRRDARTFTVNFYNVDGLSRGARVYFNGVAVGKVINIFPLMNSGSVGVKVLITNKEFPLPDAGSGVRIINDIEGGGRKILELNNVKTAANKIQIGAKMGDRKFNTEEPLLLQNASRLMLDFMQLSKDYANDFIKVMSSDDALKYQHEIQNSLTNVISSVEYGTVEQDLKQQISSLNKKLKQAERKDPHNIKTKMALLNQLDALKNTLSALNTASDVYKTGGSTPK